MSSISYSVSEYFSSRLAAELVNDGTVERREFEAIYRLLARVLKFDKRSSEQYYGRLNLTSHSPLLVYIFAVSVSWALVEETGQVHV